VHAHLVWSQKFRKSTISLDTRMPLTGDGVSRLGLETPFVRFSVSHVSGLVSVSKDVGLGLELSVSRFCMSYFFMKFCKKQLLKKRIYKVIVQNSAVQSGQWLSFLCCYATMEKTTFPLPCLKFVLNSIETVCVTVKPECIISATLATRR